jgi:hypothetical protein
MSRAADLASVGAGIASSANATAISISATEVVTLLTSAVATSEGGAVTTNISQGLAKAWANVSGVDTTVNDSFNVASSTDVSTGKKDIGFTNNMSNALYSTVAMVFFNTGTGHGMNTAVEATYSTSEFRLISITYLNNSTSTADSQAIFTQVSGDLA